MTRDAVEQGIAVSVRDEPTDVAVLGPVSTGSDGGLVVLAGPRARALLVALAHAPGAIRSSRNLIDDVWGADPPRSPMNALHTQVSRLRSALPDGALEVTAAGYRLALDRDRVDLSRAADVLRRVGEGDRDPRAVVEATATALELWRGEPGADVVGAVGERLSRDAARIRDGLLTARIGALLTLGDFESALPPARARLDAGPFDDTAAAALMRTLAGLGKVNEALDVFAEFRRTLADRLGADPSPELVTLNAELLGGATSTPRAPRAVGLRAAPNVLIGREHDIEAVQSLAAHARVVTILGPGGAGKTRLAHELGLRASSKIPVFLVELASLRSSDDVIAAIGATLGISEIDLAPGRLTVARGSSTHQRLTEALSAGPMLLILDNCEHVVGTCSEIVADMIAAGPQLTVLATSRSPMMIAAEVVYPLPPLAIDGGDGSAVALFSARARAVRPSVRLEQDAVIALCSTLDGLPLAIELAAARVRTSSVDEISTRLRDRLVLLRSADPTSPDRHRTLHAVIEWSWNLLATRDQVAMRRLCRFPDGFTLPSATAVAEWGDLVDVAEAMEALVNQSLLSVDDSAGELRYYMLETVREFGEEQLTRSGEESEVILRLNRWARDVAEDAQRRSRTDQVRLVAEIDREYGNLLAVLRWAVERRDGRTVVTVFPVLAMLWVIRGTNSEVTNWAPKVIEATAGDALHDVDAELLAETFLLVGMNTLFESVDRSFARSRIRLRTMLREREDLPPSLVFVIKVVLAVGRSRPNLPRLVAHGMRSSDPETRMAALTTRSNIRENIGDSRGALLDAVALLDYAHRIGDELGVAMSSQQIGSVYSQSGRYGEAVPYYAMSAVSMRRLGANEESLQLVHFQAGAMIAAGETVAGRTLLDQVRPESSQGSASGAENDQRRASLLVTSAEADLAEGDFELGLGRYREAMDVLGDYGPQHTRRSVRRAARRGRGVCARPSRAVRTGEHTRAADAELQCCHHGSPSLHRPTARRIGGGSSGRLRDGGRRPRPRRRTARPRDEDVRQTRRRLARAFRARGVRRRHRRRNSVAGREREGSPIQQKCGPRCSGHRTARTAPGLAVGLTSYACTFAPSAERTRRRSPRHPPTTRARGYRNARRSPIPAPRSPDVTPG
ncbi:putative ATPase/DNA-binding SARP family transcriptional activator [Rhodococcus sp. 27YEA15]